MRIAPICLTLLTITILPGCSDSDSGGSGLLGNLGFGQTTQTANPLMPVTGSDGQPLVDGIPTFPLGGEQLLPVDDSPLNGNGSFVSINGDTLTAVPGATANIAGVWDLSDENDIYYILVTADGQSFELDYDGDAVGYGENCFYIYGPDVVANLGNGLYRDSEGEFYAQVSGSLIVLTNPANGVSSAFPAVTGLSESDLNECV